MAIMGNFFEIKVNFIKTKLDYNNSKFSRLYWNFYFDWYFYASQHYQESKNASPQNKILKLPQAKQAF